MELPNFFLKKLMLIINPIFFFWPDSIINIRFSYSDLEILKIGKKIQIKSASRYGGGDLGVNGARVGRLLTALDELNS